MPGFNDLGISAPLLRGVKEMGFEEPTPVQAGAIPLLMSGRDVVGQALTGTGKTAAYGIPLLDRLNPRLRLPQAVVLAPTRELAVQVAEHLGQLGRYLNIQVLPIYGGQPIDRQLRALSRGVQCIVATPGRLMDHMRRGTVNLSEVNMLVLDEADQMLQMGFQEDVEYIAAQMMGEGRLTALFSATMPQPILNIVHKYMNNAEMLHLSKSQALTVPAVDQVYYQVPFPRKFDALCLILDSHSSERTMVFCATKRMVDEVAERLPPRGYAAEALHGDITQAGRERVLKAFRDGRTDVLVATDVAARGLDIPEVDLVINFDIPPDPEYYVHRIGRTARSGREGQAITFINPREFRELQMIERVTGAKIRRGELPTAKDAEERESQRVEERLREVIESGAWRKYRGVVEHLTSEHDVIEIAAAALAMASEHRYHRKTKAGAAPAPEPIRSFDEPRPPREPRYDSRPRPEGGFRRPEQRAASGGFRADGTRPRPPTATGQGGHKRSGAPRPPKPWGSRKRS